MQGQTTYGGLSAALCLEGARRLLGEDAPPLRSANITFVGAAGGDVDVNASFLRRGKAMAFINSTVSRADAPATACTFLFGHPRVKSTIDVGPETFVTPLPANLPGPEESPSLFEGFPERGPNTIFPPIFTQHVEMRLASGAPPGSGSSIADHFVWARHVGADANGGAGEGVHPEVALLALGDTLPPASTSLFKAPAPVSSTTWHLNVIDTSPTAFEGGWWLLRTRAESARLGYSSQDMELWGASGLVWVERQCVAIYA